MPLSLYCFGVLVEGQLLFVFVRSALYTSNIARCGCGVSYVLQCLRD
jgi:hypothetical protein